jgi:hypothetical protein
VPCGVSTTTEDFADSNSPIFPLSTFRLKTAHAKLTLKVLDVGGEACGGSLLSASVRYSTRRRISKTILNTAFGTPPVGL